MRTTLLLALALLAGCAQQPDTSADTRQRFTAFLDSKMGLTEPNLVRAMKRMPDANYQPDPATRMLMWKLAATFTTPGQSPEYLYVNGGIVPVGGKAATTATEYCNVEWLVVDGLAKAYTLRGKGCP